MDFKGIINYVSTRNKWETSNHGHVEWGLLVSCVLRGLSGYEGDGQRRKDRGEKTGAPTVTHHNLILPAPTPRTHSAFGSSHCDFTRLLLE